MVEPTGIEPISNIEGYTKSLYNIQNKGVYK